MKIDRFKKIERVYVAGPYTGNGMRDRDDNVKKAIMVADELFAIGYRPFVPHLFHYWDAVSRRPYEEWMTLDLCYLGICDALLRMPGHSPGADREVEHANKLGIPVFWSIADLVCES